MREVPVVYDEYSAPMGPVTDCSVEPSLTRQSEKDSCDINLIMKRFEKTGVLPEFVNEGWYGDVSEIGDYREVRDRINEVVKVFDKLPANERSRFNNDPAVFFDFITDESNKGEMVEMGLLVADDKPPEAAVPPVVTS